MAKKKESLIVASKVKAYIKSKKMMTSSDALEAISDQVYCMLDAAIAPQHRQSTGSVVLVRSPLVIYFWPDG